MVISHLSHPMITLWLCVSPSIGLAIARRLGRDGAKVVISSRKQENVDSTVKTLSGEGLEVAGVKCHVGNPADRQALVEQVRNVVAVVGFVVGFSLKMCSKSGKFRAEIGVQCGKASLKMLPVKTDDVYEQIGSPIRLNCCKLLHF